MVWEVAVWQPAVPSDFTSHSSAPIALPCCHPTRTLILCPAHSCPHARHTTPSPLTPLCSTPASPSISRLSCPTSPTPRTIRLPQCICRQQDGQPGWCFSRYCGHLAPGWCSTAPQPELGLLTLGLGHLVSARVPRGTFTETAAAPCCCQRAGRRARRCRRKSFPMLTSHGSCGRVFVPVLWGRGWRCQGPRWLQGETQVVPDCGRWFLQ